LTAAGSLAPREHFPVLEEVVYLNAASIGLVPLPVQRAEREFEDDVARRGTVGFDDAAEARALEGARTAAARLLGADRDEIAITTSATEALGQVAWWLRPGAGTNVVSIDIEFPSATYPWFRIAEETGAEVRLVRAIADPGALTLDDLAAAVDEATAVVCVSHVQYATGLRFDLTQLAELAHAHGATLVVDATQSAGMVPIDVRAADVDILVAGAYKWLCGVFGAAICYLRPEIRERFSPPLVGWRSTVEPFAFDATRMPLAREARRMEFSTMAYGAAVALAAAIDYLLAFGIERILAHDLALAGLLARELEAQGAQVLSPRDDGLRSGIVTARFPGRDGERIAARLNEAGVIVSPRFGSTRFSVHLFNEVSDLKRATALLEEILPTSELD
jgi:cysteine desulfurase/selenocysteine lyase